jgi:hypothetical protein
LPVELCRCRLDTCGVGYIQGQHSQIVAARVSQSAQLGGETWITTSRVNMPTIAKYCRANSNPSPRLAPVIKALGIAFSIA